MNYRDPQTIIRNLYHKNIKKIDNVIYADKLFIINTIISYLFKNKSYREIDQFKVNRYAEYINKFLLGEVDIYWENGILMVRDLENDDRFEGG